MTKNKNDLYYISLYNIKMAKEYFEIDFEKLNGGWREVFENSMDELNQIAEILSKLENEGKIIYPLKKDIFNAFYLTPLEKIKCIIIGQDPYQNFNFNLKFPVAMGLSFSVRQGEKIPPSLQNIFKEIKNNYPETFNIPKTGDLTPWTQKGVFLLNSCLTVEDKKSGAHCGKYTLWLPFIRNVLKAISNVYPNCIFLLWGKDAQDLKKYIGEKSQILESSHPSPFSVNKGFNGCKHFLKVNKLLKNDEIDWNLNT